MAKVIVMDHPLIQHKIGFIRNKTTGTKTFRETVSEIAMLICYEATRDLQLSDVEIEIDPESELRLVKKGDLKKLTVRGGLRPGTVITVR